MYDFARHRVRQRDVAADAQPEPHVGPLRARCATRIHDVQTRAVVPDPLEQVMEPDWVRLTRVRAPEEDDVRLLYFGV
jgi:hypothetical protein